MSDDLRIGFLKADVARFCDGLVELPAGTTSSCWSCAACSGVGASARVVHSRFSGRSRVPETSRSSTVTPGSTTFLSTRRLVARSNSRVGRSEPILARWYSQRASVNHWSNANVV